MSHPGDDRGDADPFAAFLVGDGRNIAVAASSSADARSFYHSHPYTSLEIMFVFSKWQKVYAVVYARAGSF